MKRTAVAVWTGGLRDGKGSLSTRSNVLRKAQYGFEPLAEEGCSTSPEELLAAAHAGCFTIALATQLERRGLTPDSLRTRAAVTLGRVDGAYAITAVHLDLVACVPGAEPVSFRKIVDRARIECRISNVLNARITLATKLES